MPGPNWVREYQDGDLVPGTPYRVIKLMGAGGMGSVYEVEHIELGRRYVLKSLLCTLTSRQDLIARMRNEWRALGQLDHRNIVDVVNAGATSNGVPFYVMELLLGETLAIAWRAKVGCRSPKPYASRRGCCWGSTRRTRSGSCTATSNRRTSS